MRIDSCIGYHDSRFAKPENRLSTSHATSLEEEVDVELGLAAACAAAAAGDGLGGELEDVEARLPDVGVVADDVAEVTVPQVLQLPVREKEGIV